MQSLCTALGFKRFKKPSSATHRHLPVEGFPKTKLKQWDKRESQQMLSLSDLSPRSVATPDQSQARLKQSAENFSKF